MSVADQLRHRMLLVHPGGTDPQSPEGQPLTADGQPIGDTSIVSTDISSADWVGASEVRCLVQERKANWPDGPGAGSELVNTRIFFRADTSVIELDKGLRIDVDPPQAYQITFVDRLTGYGRADHIETVARRIPL